MPVRLPRDDETNLQPPTAVEVYHLGRGVVTAIAGNGGLTPLQEVLVRAVFDAMTGVPVDASSLPPISPEEFAEGLARRNEIFRTRILQIMLLGALVLHPLPEDVVARVGAFARELGVSDRVLDVARGYAHGSLGLALLDFDRNGYRERWTREASDPLHTSAALDEAWSFAVDDPALAARWQSLADLPDATLGRRVHEFYRARGFRVPGLPGSAPPYLAQHDWVHVLADYGTTVESELEVFGFIARATDDPRGFALLAMVIGLFETGYEPHAAGLFEADTGHLSASGMADRLADAMRRGALCRGLDGEGDVRFMDMDWFSVADLPVAELRRRLGLPPKSPRAMAAGSVGPWQPGGISPFQLAAGQQAAREEGYPYDDFGASVASDNR